jgi:LmbE family N-acetylglucosaminyl deacetylase
MLAGTAVQLYAPLGVGNHVDHLEVAVATIQAAIASDALSRVAFYEDFYALSEALRRRHPVTTSQTWPLTQIPGWSAPLLGVALRSMAFVAKGPTLADYLPVTRTMAWRCTPQPVTGFEDVKISAIAAYRTQTARLGGMTQLRCAIRRADRIRGGELVWRATLPETPDEPPQR